MRDDHPLSAGQPLRLTEIEEALDLLVGAADGENPAPLVDAPRDADVLARGRLGEAREDREELRRRG